MVTFRHILPLAALFALAGCFSPAGWTLQLEAEVECGMTVEEVQALASRSVREYASRYETQKWQTHHVGSGDEQVYLGFDEGRLLYVQVEWANNLMSIATYPVIDLCVDGEIISSQATETPQ